MNITMQLVIYIIAYININVSRQQIMNLELTTCSYVVTNKMVSEFCTVGTVYLSLEYLVTDTMETKPSHLKTIL